MEIARKSGDLYDKFVGFVEDLKAVGEKIQSSQRSYEDAMNKLATGRGNLIRRAEEIKTMGAKVSKALPNAMVEGSATAEDES